MALRSSRIPIVHDCEGIRFAKSGEAKQPLFMCPGQLCRYCKMFHDVQDLIDQREKSSLSEFAAMVHLRFSELRKLGAGKAAGDLSVFRFSVFVCESSFSRRGRNRNGKELLLH